MSSVEASSNLSFPSDNVETTTSDFLVGKVIGEGSFGRVVHCKHKRSGKDVAVKVVAKVVLQKRKSCLQFVLNEQRLLKELKDLPSVVNLWASFHDSECVYLVMECANAGNLQDAIQQGRTTKDWISTAAHYSLQILKALEEIHSRNIVHSDLSPQNILIRTDSHLRIQIADFGSAIELKGDASSVENIQDRGSSDYASPELLRRVDTAACLTFAIDFWAFGCLLYAMIEGQSPFHAASDTLAVQKILDYADEKDSKSRNKPIFLNKPFRTSWRVQIEGLLEPDPLRRMENSASAKQLEESSIWKDVDLDQEPRFVPQKPSWLVASEAGDMLDGSHGWSAFLS